MWFLAANLRGKENNRTTVKTGRIAKSITFKRETEKKGPPACESVSVHVSWDDFAHSGV